jgi:hypothetical protein
LIPVHGFFSRPLISVSGGAFLRASARAERYSSIFPCRFVATLLQGLACLADSAGVAPLHFNQLQISLNIESHLVKFTHCVDSLVYFITIHFTYIARLADSFMPSLTSLAISFAPFTVKCVQSVPFTDIIYSPFAFI